MSDTKFLPVIEIFGPTIQGEGIDQGRPTYFVRFGGCDYRCSWCDTPHAVLPAEIRKNRRSMSAAAIVNELTALGGASRWVVLSGGNPALLELYPLIQSLQARGYRVACETQGTKWKNWLRVLDRLCVSPKPPSSGEDGIMFPEVQKFLTNSVFIRPVAFGELPQVFLKVVVFDDADYEWAKALHLRYKGVPFYLSAGNDAGRTVGNPDRKDFRATAHVRQDLLEQSKWLTEKVINDPEMSEVIIQSQQHVLLWGNELGR